MKYSKLIAVTFAVALCIGAIPLFVGSADDVAADDATPTESVLDLKKGDSWGQGVQLNYKDLEPAITEIVKELFPGIIADDAALLPGLADFVKEYLIAEATADEVFYIFDPTTIQSLVLRLNFDINEAILAEVVKADNNGYTVDVFGGISINGSVGVSIKADFIKEGTYEFDKMDESERALREVYLDLDLFAKLMVSGTIEFNKEGGIVGADLALGIAFNVDLRTNLDLAIDLGVNGYASIWDLLDGNIPIVPESLGIKYKNVTYGLGVDLKLTAKATASRGGIILIPTTLSEDVEQMWVSSIIEVSGITILAKLTVTPDLEKLVDGMFGKGFVESEIMNFTVPFEGDSFGVPGIKILSDGQLNLSTFVLDLVDEVFNLIVDPMRYQIFITGDYTTGFTVKMVYQDGTTYDGSSDVPNLIENTLVENFLWEDIKTFEIDFLGSVNTDVADIVKKLGLPENAFVFKYLEGNEKSSVKNVVNNIKNAKGGNGGSGDTLFFAGIGIAAVAAIGVVGFLMFRKS